MPCVTSCCLYYGLNFAIRCISCIGIVSMDTFMIRYAFEIIIIT